MRTDVKITIMLENPMLRVEKDPTDDRICSSVFMQKLLNTWITTGTLMKAAVPNTVTSCIPSLITSKYSFGIFVKEIALEIENQS
jgi:hypothetical protein